MKGNAVARSIFLSALFLAGASVSVFAQTSPSVLANAASAFSNGKAITQVTLNATAQWTAGSDEETGNATLTANADGSYSVQLQLSQSARTEAQTSFASGQSCTWAGTDGVVQAAASQNCMGSMAWFLPQVALFGNQQPGAVATSIQSATLGDGASVLDVGQQTTPDASLPADAAALIAHLSSMDLYLDPASYLPVGLAFNTHPDQNAAADIPVQVVFGGYQTVSGVSIPFHIQRYVNGSLQLDLAVTQASAN
jgi:hypothetical protein